MVTADHGNDPTTAGTDHSREYVPLLVAGNASGAGVDLGTRRTFADVGQTLAELFGVGPLADGTSFLQGDRRHIGWPAIRIGSTIREELEQREREILAPQAAKSADSRGRLRPKRKTTSGRRFSATAIASSTARRSAVSSTRRRCSSRRPATTTGRG